MRVEGSRFPSGHQEQLALEDSRELCEALVPSRDVHLGRAGRPPGVGSGLRWERLGRRREHTYLLCSTNSLCEGKRKRQRRPGRECVIPVPPWFSVSSLSPPAPILWPPGFPQPLVVVVGVL